MITKLVKNSEAICATSFITLKSQLIRAALKFRSNKNNLKKYAKIS